MADRKISDLTALTTPAAGDYLPIVDISEASAANKNKRITIEELLRGAPDGTAGAPSIAFESDPNTGIYSPGADQVAISTNGTGRLFVDASGNVGVGIGSPIALGKVLNIYGGASEGSSIALEANNGAEFCTIFSGATAADPTSLFSKSGFKFAIATAKDATGFSEKARIRADGTVEIKGAGTAGVSPAVSVNPSAPANSAVMDSSGRLGLGTSSPDRLLHVSAADTAYIRLENQDSTGSVDQYVGLIEFEGQDSGGSGVRAQIGGIYEGVSGATALVFGTSADAGSVTERLRINRNGSVGIGTTNPTTPLVVSASGAAGMEITPGSAGASSGTLIEHYNRSTAAYTLARTIASAHRFDISGTEAARIDSSGRLLVGTSTSRNLSGNTGTFQVEGLTYQVASITANSNDAFGSYVVLTKSRGTSLGSNTIVQNNDSLGGILINGTDGANAQYAAKIEAFVDGTPGANDMPGRIVLSTTSDGASSPTERLRITNAGVLQVADAGNISVGTTTGTKIGTATTQKLGFFNKTPVVQPTAVADATDAASVITQLNALLSRMRDLGLIAT